MVGAGDCGGRYGRGSDGGSGVVSGGGAELWEAGVHGRAERWCSWYVKL